MEQAVGQGTGEETIWTGAGRELTKIGVSRRPTWDNCNEHYQFLCFLPFSSFRWAKGDTSLSDVV